MGSKDNEIMLEVLRSATGGSAMSNFLRDIQDPKLIAKAKRRVVFRALVRVSLILMVVVFGAAAIVMTVEAFFNHGSFVLAFLYALAWRASLFIRRVILGRLK